MLPELFSSCGMHLHYKIFMNQANFMKTNARYICCNCLFRCLPKNIMQNVNTYINNVIFQCCFVFSFVQNHVIKPLTSLIDASFKRTNGLFKAWITSLVWLCESKENWNFSCKQEQSLDHLRYQTFCAEIPVANSWADKCLWLLNRTMSLKISL